VSVSGNPAAPKRASGTRPGHPRFLWRLPALLATSAVVAAVGCGPMSPLDPESEAARRIATLWWAMLVVALIVFGGAVAMLVAAWVRRAEWGLPRIGERPRLFDASVVVFGIAIPVVVLVGLFVWANVGLVQETDSPPANSTAMKIEVTGNQWWWEARYPGTPAVTANEIHIPARTPVTIETSSRDVIHSFWIPRLNRKADSIPGHLNRVELFADAPGVYRGSCAEFCGQQHARMGVAVHADPPETFRAWLAAQGRPRTAPATPLARRGEQVFTAKGCASCHSIRGTRARGEVGPDLTHVKSRATLAALTIPNERPRVTEWIADPQKVKEGAKMPALDLTPPELEALAEYLEGLR
jgi:cytochrome c oxidase subunit II